MRSVLTRQSVPEETLKQGLRIAVIFNSRGHIRSGHILKYLIARKVIVECLDEEEGRMCLCACVKEKKRKKREKVTKST